MAQNMDALVSAIKKRGKLAAEGHRLGIRNGKLRLSKGSNPRASDKGGHPARATTGASGASGGDRHGVVSLLHSKGNNPSKPPPAGRNQ